ncbi:MAG: mechanosensitive ion channel [Bacteroidales bacterium]|nr:mechanosensitive ion channel [Bacteroidales bacterium]
MNTADFQWTGFTVYLFLALAVVLLLLFRILRIGIHLLPTGRRKKDALVRFVPATEIFVWLLFTIWAIQLFWDTNRLYALIMAVILTFIILWLCWFALRDFLAGALFRVDKGFQKDEMIRVGEYSGKIRELKHRYLLLETGSGEIIHIPYTKLQGQIITKSHPAAHILGHTFQIRARRSSGFRELSTSITESLLNLPYISVKKPPQIKRIGEEEDDYLLEITAYAVNAGFFPDIEHAIRMKYSAEADNSTNP